MKKVVKKPAAKMQDGGKVKIKVKIKPDRKQAREDKDKMSLIKDAEMNLKKPSMKKGGVAKAKSGGSFPDLNKDGKVTKADVLVGRGVIKAQGGGLFAKIAAKRKGMMGGAGNMMGGLMGMLRRKKQASAAPAAEAQPAMKKGGKLKKQAAVAIAMKKAGKTPKTMKSGGKMGKCRYGCN